MPDPPSSEFSLALRHAMSQRDLSFSALAERTREVDPAKRGLSKSHLVNLSRRRQPPSLRAFGLLHAVLGLPVDEIAEGRSAAGRHLAEPPATGKRCDGCGVDAAIYGDAQVVTEEAAGAHTRVLLCANCRQAVAQGHDLPTTATLRAVERWARGEADPPW